MLYCHHLSLLSEPHVRSVLFLFVLLLLGQPVSQSVVGRLRGGLVAVVHYTTKPTGPTYKLRSALFIHSQLLSFF